MKVFAEVHYLDGAEKRKTFYGPTIAMRPDAVSAAKDCEDWYKHLERGLSEAEMRRRLQNKSSLGDAEPRRPGPEDGR